MRPIFCGNFEYDARQSDLERLFGRYGKVDRVDIKSGFAFVYMEDERDAEDAIRGLDRREFGRKGRRLRVEWTKQERGIRRPGGSRRPSTNTKPSKTLFVINFDPYHTRTKDLERHFDPYGKIVSVRIRRNFAFIQYESQEDASRALEATNMSNLMDRVISVEFAVRDDDERKDGYSPDRSRDRSLEAGRDRRRSPSPYRRERDSPDYGRGMSPYKRQRDSPDYGRGRSPSPYRRERVSPDYGRGRSPNAYRRERGGPDRGRGSRSPYRRDRVTADHVSSPNNGCVPSSSALKRERSPENAYRRERGGPDLGRDNCSPYRRDRVNADHISSPNKGRVLSSSPLKRERSPEKAYRRERGGPDRGRDSRSPYRRDRGSADHISSPNNGRVPSLSPLKRERSPENGCHHNLSPGRKRANSENGRGPSPNSLPDPRDSPNYGGPESPMNGRYNSRPPQEEE